MKLSKVLLACGMFLGVAALSVPAQAGLCPAAGVATDCNLTITFNANGSITTALGPDLVNSTYDGVEDVLIGVINNTTHAITSFVLTGGGANPQIFGFDGDGVCTFIACGPNPNDTTGYGGPHGFFTGINAALTSGTVNFAPGIAAGATDFFSLEFPASLSIIVGAPEPTTMALLGIALLGAGLGRRRKS